MTPASFEKFRRAISYCPETGEFTWLVNAPPRGRAGELCVGISSHGYRRVSIGGERHYGHRLAWLYVTGTWPFLIDHIDGNKLNNRFSNLRLATKGQNVSNSKLARNSTTGFKGVYINKRNGKYIAHIQCKRRVMYLGSFDSPESAHARYIEVASDLFGEFARWA